MLLDFRTQTIKILWRDYVNIKSPYFFLIDSWIHTVHTFLLSFLKWGQEGRHIHNHLLWGQISLKNMSCYIYSPTTCIRMFIAGLFKIAPNWKLPICPPTAEWVQCGINSGILYDIVMRIIYNYTQQCRWISQNGGKQNNAYKKEHTVWFQFYKVQTHKQN